MKRLSLALLLTACASNAVRNHFGVQGLAFPLDVSGLQSANVDVSSIETGQVTPNESDKELFHAGLKYVAERTHGFWHSMLPKAEAFVLSHPAVMIEANGERLFTVAVMGYGAAQPPFKAMMVSIDVWHFSNIALFRRGPQGFEFAGWAH